MTASWQAPSFGEDNAALDSFTEKVGFWLPFHHFQKSSRLNNSACNPGE